MQIGISFLRRFQLKQYENIDHVTTVFVNISIIKMQTYLFTDRKRKDLDVSQKHSVT